MIKFLNLFILLFFASCAPNGSPIWAPSWTLDVPFILNVDSNSFISTSNPPDPTVDLTKEEQNTFSETIHLAFGHAITQLGGTILSPGSKVTPQVVNIKYDKKCFLSPDSHCPSCNNHTAAHTDEISRTTIQVCPRYLKEPKDGLWHNVIHESGHVLGPIDHLEPIGPCPTPDKASINIMTAYYDCTTNHKDFSEKDKVFIFSAGRLHGNPQLPHL